MSPKRISLADVAKLAGVSSNTVSRVVRGDPEVADKTRARISQLLQELDYRPNLAARALAAKRTGVMHVLLTAPMYHGHALTFLSITNAAAHAGFTVSVSDLYGSARLQRKSQTMPPIDVDGVIVIGGQGPAVELATRLGDRMPTVLVLTGEQNLTKVSTVAVDNKAGARAATAHLLASGTESIVHIAGPWDWLDAVDRKRGFEEVCAERGVEAKVIPADSWDASAGFEIARSWAKPPPSVFAANDQLALGVIRGLRESGVAIPDSTKVVGFDDIAGADCFSPPLSTVAQPFTLVGRTAVDYLRELIAGGATSDTSIEPSLIVRASSS